jgi:hypothetical protein
MKSIIKKVSMALLTIPMLALGISCLNVAPAYALENCPSSTSGYTSPRSGCTAAGGSTQWWYNGVRQNTQVDWNAANEAACSPNGIKNGLNCAHGNDQPDTLFGSGGIVTTIINVMLFIVGILCVIMIVFGGIRYTTSTGDKGRIDNAKNTIIYAVVGLIVAIVAYALVNWVFEAFTGN